MPSVNLDLKSVYWHLLGVLEMFSLKTWLEVGSMYIGWGIVRTYV